MKNNLSQLLKIVLSLVLIVIAIKSVNGYLYQKKIQHQIEDFNNGQWDQWITKEKEVETAMQPHIKCKQSIHNGITAINPSQNS